MGAEGLGHSLYFESVSVIIALISLGKYLEAKLTATPSAEGSALSAFSTVPEQTTHVMPCTLKVSVFNLLASLNFSYHIISAARASVKLLFQPNNNF